MIRRAVRVQAGRAQPYLLRWRELWSGRLGRLRLKEEERLAIQCQDWLRLALPQDAIAFHIANEGQRAKVGWAVQLAMGLIPGMPDTLILRGGGFAYLVEYKTGKRKLSADQEAVRDWAVAHDIPHAVVRDLDELIAFCRAQLLVPVDSSVKVM